MFNLGKWSGRDEVSGWMRSEGNNGDGHGDSDAGPDLQRCKMYRKTSRVWCEFIGLYLFAEWTSCFPNKSFILNLQCRVA